VIRGNVFLGKCVFKEMVYTDIVRVEMLYGKLFRGDMVIRENVPNPKKYLLEVFHQQNFFKNIFIATLEGYYLKKKMKYSKKYIKKITK
jgi:glutathionyl-hydroquinone reductase